MPRLVIGRIANRLSHMRPARLGEPLLSSRQVTPRWLTEVLRKTGASGDARVVKVDVSQEQWSTTSVLTRLILRYSQGAPPSAPVHLILKRSRPDIEPRIQEYAGQEATYYLTIGATQGALSPACYDAVYAPENGRTHVLIEDLSSSHESTEWPLPPSLERCHDTLDAFAKAHAFWWAHPELGRGVGDLPTPEKFEVMLRATDSQFQRFADYWGDWLSDARRRRFENVLAALSNRRESITPKNGLTVVHGDAHFGNVLYPKAGDGTLRVIDWQFWHIGRGATDIAYLIALHWYPERRQRFERDFLERYHRALMSYGVSEYSIEDCWHDYRMAVALGLLPPVWQWSWGLKPVIWSHYWERAMLAFEDLNCIELFE